MQNRVRKIANFFAFNILFFAVYLNFIGKSKTPVSAEPAKPASAFSASLLQVPQPRKPVSEAMAALK